MGSTQFGNFHDFCRDSTLPICNIFSESLVRGGPGFGRCNLEGIHLSNGNQLRNLGSILFCALAIVIAALLLWRSELKQAAVGRREMQLFLVGYIVIEICEIFTVGGFPLSGHVTLVFTAVHVGAITATLWILLLNAVVGFQVLDDGTILSVGAIMLSAAVIFIGTGYITLDTAFGWTGYFTSSLNPPENRNIALYVLYQVAPLAFLFFFFVLESLLVLHVLGERRPMAYLVVAALLFVVGQIFQYVISIHICLGTSGKIDGSLFETFFTLASVVMIWVFWSSITEDDWPMPTASAGTYT